MIEERFSLLLVDCDTRWGRRLGQLVERSGLRFDFAQGLPEACESLRGKASELVAVGFGDPNWLNTKALRELRESAPQARRIALLDEPSEKYERLLRQSGFDEFLPRKIVPSQLATIFSQHAEVLRLEAELAYFQGLVEGRTCFEALLGGSAPMRALYRLIEQVSRTDAPVLVSGEAGVEFAEVAQSLHRRSERSMHPLIAIDCKRGAAEEVENSIFGPLGHDSYARGPSPEGSAFAQAGKGSLVFYNVEAMGAQALGRVVEFLRNPFFQGETSTTPQPIARIIATSTADLKSLVESGEFNREFFYRMSILQVQVPPLRERREDIPLLAENFLQQLNRSPARKKGPAIALDSESILDLFRYSWPGNVEELTESLGQAVRDTKTYRIRPEHLALQIEQSKPRDAVAAPAPDGEPVPLRQAKRGFETDYFKNLLEQTRGNMTLASKISKVGRPYLYKKLKEYDIEPSDFR